jgi:hypothetical protein
MSAPQQDPYSQAYNQGYGMASPRGSGPAQTSLLGQEVSLDRFKTRDQSFIPDLEKNFSQSQYGFDAQNNKFGDAYTKDFLKEENIWGDKGSGGGSGLFEKRYDYDYGVKDWMPTDNFKMDFQNWSQAQDWYKKYFNTSQGYLNNAMLGNKQKNLDWLGSQTTNDLGTTWSPENKYYQGLSSAYDRVGETVKQRQQAALQAYLELYNKFGSEQGAFGSGFRARTSPFTLEENF